MYLSRRTPCYALESEHKGEKSNQMKEEKKKKM